MQYQRASNLVQHPCLISSLHVRLAPTSLNPSPLGGWGFGMDDSSAPPRVAVGLLKKKPAAERSASTDQTTVVLHKLLRKRVLQLGLLVSKTECSLQVHVGCWTFRFRASSFEFMSPPLNQSALPVNHCNCTATVVTAQSKGCHWSKHHLANKRVQHLLDDWYTSCTSVQAQTDPNHNPKTPSPPLGGGGGGHVL